MARAVASLKLAAGEVELAVVRITQPPPENPQFPVFVEPDMHRDGTRSRRRSARRERPRWRSERATLMRCAPHQRLKRSGGTAPGRLTFNQSPLRTPPMYGDPNRLQTTPSSSSAQAWA